MKTRTHYLYGFIIVLLVIALVITSVSKRTPKTIETTPPVERTPEMVTLPPSDTDEDTDEDTDDNTDIIYDDKYYTIATYLFYCFWFFSIALTFSFSFYLKAYGKDANLEYWNQITFPMGFIMIWLSILSFAFAVVSLSVDTLHGYQKILMILFTLFIPISMIIGGVLFAITPPPPNN